MTKVRTPTEARQGERGKPMLWVLTISTAAAVVLLVVGYLYIQSQPDSELAEPVLQTTSSSEQPG